MFEMICSFVYFSLRFGHMRLLLKKTHIIVAETLRLQIFSCFDKVTIRETTFTDSAPSTHFITFPTFKVSALGKRLNGILVFIVKEIRGWVNYFVTLCFWEL